MLSKSMKNPVRVIFSSLGVLLLAIGIGAGISYFSADQTTATYLKEQSGRKATLARQSELLLGEIDKLNTGIWPWNQVADHARKVSMEEAVHDFNDRINGLSNSDADLAKYYQAATALVKSFNTQVTSSDINKPWYSAIVGRVNLISSVATTVSRKAVLHAGSAPKEVTSAKPTTTTGTNTTPSPTGSVKPDSTPQPTKSPGKAASKAVRTAIVDRAAKETSETGSGAISPSITDTAAKTIVTNYTVAVNNYGAIRQTLLKIDDPELKREIAVIDARLALVSKNGSSVALNPLTSLTQLLKYTTSNGYKDRLSTTEKAAFGLLYDKVVGLNDQAKLVITALDKSSDNKDFKTAIATAQARVPDVVVPPAPPAAPSTGSTVTPPPTSLVAETEPKVTEGAAVADATAAAAAAGIKTGESTAPGTVSAPGKGDNGAAIVNSVLDVWSKDALAGLEKFYSDNGIGDNESILDRYWAGSPNMVAARSAAKNYLSHVSGSSLVSLTPEYNDVLMDILVSLPQKQAMIVLKTVTSKGGYPSLSDSEKTIFSEAINHLDLQYYALGISSDQLVSLGLATYPEGVTGASPAAAVKAEAEKKNASASDMSADPIDDLLLNELGVSIDSSNYDLYRDIASSINEIAAAKGTVCNEICASAMGLLLADGNYDRYEAVVNQLVGSPIISLLKGKDDNETILNVEKYLKSTIKTDDFFKNVYRTSMSISPMSGKLEYFTFIKKKVCDIKYEGTTDVIDECFNTAGYVSLDPQSGKATAKVPFKMGGSTATFYSNPGTGDMYVEVTGNKVNAATGTLKPLASAGKMFQLESYTIAADGTMGGTFKSFGKVFKYNPNTKALEIPIKLAKRGSFTGSMTIDTKGNLAGNVTLGNSKTGTANLYFDRAGNIVLSKELDIFGKSITGADGKLTKSVLGSLSLSSNGGIAGNINLTKVLSDEKVMKALGMKKDLGIKTPINLGFSKRGIESLSFNVAKIAGQSFSLSIARNGAMSFGGFIPVGPIPVPVSLGQDQNGNFRLMWPGGSLKLSHDKRPLNAPAISANEDGTQDASQVYFRHSFKKLLMTVRVYQTPPETIDLNEQVERSAMIFDTFNQKIGRNPSVKEFMNWYFYSGHELYKYPDHNQKDYRMTATKAALEKAIEKGSGKAVPKDFKMDTKKEFTCVQKYSRAQCRQPADVMTSNPFASSASGMIDNIDTEDNSLGGFVANAITNLGDDPAPID